MLKTLKKKIYNAQQQMGNFSREMEMIGKGQMEMVEMKDTVTQMKNSLANLIKPRKKSPNMKTHSQEITQSRAHVLAHTCEKKKRKKNRAEHAKFVGEYQII